MAGLAALQMKSHYRADNVYIAGTRSAVVLPHHVQFAREMLIEGMARANGESVSHPIIQTPVVEYLVGHITGELRLVNFEWMFQLHSVAIAPGVNLRCGAQDNTLRYNLRHVLSYLRS